ncbi:amino acid adenylation domain-containing protein, partial [Chitinophaga sp. RAB17]|uniref:amino acid adenylation domain-containing protein n=1 Tax=Chitinophaga sp. RAB17 TaxID=3233049 RepID=UPI003F8F457B
MSELNLAHILRLLKDGEDAGINISFVDNELRVQTTGEQEIDEHYLKQLRDNKHHLITFFKNHGLKQEGIAEINTIPSYNRNVITRIPLSYGQERLWFLDRLEGSVHYHVPVVLKLKGKIDRAALQYALQNIINRHEVLRTVIREEDGIAYQHILPPDNWQLADISNPGNHQQDIITHFLNQPFDLSADHMLRAGLMRLKDNDHVLALVMHHIASDGWSDTVIVKELVELYSAHTEGRAPKLSPLPVQYADYAIWQREYISGKVLAELQHYWEGKLSGLEPLNLPADYARPAIQSTRGAVLDLVLDQGIAAAANRLSQQQGTTLFMVLLSVLKVLLYRYSGQEDICVGTPVAGRRRREIESLVGFFINTLAIRSNLDDNTTFTTLLQQVKEAVLEGFDHQELPFEKVVDAVVKERNNSVHPLFQVMFVLQNGKKSHSITLGDASLFPERPEHHTAKFDLTFTIVEERDKLLLTVEYCTDLYKEDTIRQMATHYEQLLTSAVSKPEEKIGVLPMLAPAEERMLLDVFSGKAAGYPKNKTIVDLFEEQVAIRPDAVAVVYEDQQLTYRQLNERANQLGHLLRSKGVKEETLVPICINRSLEMIVGIMGILKAGGAYVPVDPLYPEDRIRYMLKDTRATVAVSNLSSSAVCNAVPGIKTVIVLDTDLEIINDQPVHAVESIRSAEHAAYVIYTSGSTGRPKGVLIEHVNVVRLFETDSPLYDFNEKDVWSMFHSFCFDFSVWEMYGALFYGGRLVVVPREATQDTTLFGQLLLEQKITVLNQTPSAFYVLQDYLTAHADTVSVRYVIFGGEALNPAKIKTWKAAYPGCRLINMYGITETTVHVTYQELQAAHLESSTSVIGKPIPTLYAYVLNGSRTLVPIGVPGELYIGGAGLAREYLNLPALSAERFIANPFMPGGRLYKTGDLARWLPDGNLEYLGRIDAQVKIRGFRIELGEIENVLQQSGLVSGSVIAALTDITGNKRLVGYVVPKGDFDKEALQSWLKAYLPEYMVPAIWVPLEEIPLTGNGKVNRKSLPDPDLNRIARTGFVAPRNESEARLATIWEELLGVERVGIYDNFFELGGDSIRVIRVVSKISQAFDKQLRVFDVYRANTIHELAALLDKQDTDGDQRTKIYNEAAATLASLRNTLLPQLPDRELIEDIYPMSDIESGMVYASMMNPEEALYHDQLVGRIPAQFDATLIEKALGILTTRHSILRTAFRLGMDTRDIQVVYKSVEVTVDYFDIRQADKKELKNIIQDYLEEERKKPFEFAVAPLWRVSLFGRPTYSVMVLQVHHAILDGWSVASLITELLQLCKRLLSAEEPVTLLPLKSSYRDFILESMANRQDSRNNTFWQLELDGYKRLDIFSKETAYHTFSRRYGSDFLYQLKEKAKQDNISLKGLFLGAYLFSLNMLTYEEELTIGLVTNNRPVKEDGDKVLGCFLNTIPFRLEMDKREATWQMYFESIEKKLVQLKEHDRISLLEIANITKEPAAAGKNPFFDAMFNFVNFHVYETLDKDIQDGLVLEEVDSSAFEGYDVTNTYLDCTVSLTADVFTVSYTLRRALASGKTPEELEGYFNMVLMHYLEHYNEHIAEGKLLPAREESHLLKMAEGATADYPQQKTLVSLFEDQVLQTPDAIAVMYEDTALTYRELDERSNQLGHYLRKQGVKADQLVPVCIDRSLDMIVALLGILKAGGAYVPIDPTYPAARISFMLKDVAADILLCHSINASRIEGLVDNVQVLTLDGQASLIRQEPVYAVNTDLHPDNLAYVIYTSGSTGIPKGVMNAHSGIVNRLLWGQDYFGLDASDVVLQKTTFCFDISVWELFWPLLTGARLVFAQPGGEKDGEYIRRTVERYGVTTIHFVPTMLQIFTEGLTAGACPGLRRVLCSGEALQAGHIRSYQDKLTAPLYNLYGPTETAIEVSYWPATHRTSISEVVPIGRPVANTRFYILDASGNLAPAGVPGELYIGGNQVARGYLNREELTVHRFVSSPFRANERMYRTGDLVRWLPDTNVEYLGRIDEQVKIRGYRIELGEIESVLQESGLVKQVVVLAKADSTNNKQLVAYIVPEPVFSREQAVKYLGQRLPEYMVPALWVTLEVLPVTANGKVDKKSLPDPEINLVAAEYVAPRNETEQLLAEIWQQLLGVSRIGIYDNFFELGGHSLLGMRIVAALRQRENIKLSIRDLFTHADIAGLAGFIRTNGIGSGLPAITASVRPERIPLSYSQERLWFIDQLDGSIQYHIPAILRLKGSLDQKALADALTAIVSRHEILRTIIRSEEGKPYQQVLDTGLWQLQIITDHPYNDLQEYIHALIATPFDLSADHMLRAHLFVLNEAEYILVITLHHIAADAWSASIIVQELVELYSACTGGRMPVLPVLPLQYADYAIWQRTYLSGAVSDSKLDYWQDKLSGVSTLQLPVDYPRQLSQQREGAQVSFTVGAGLRDELKLLSQKQGISLFMTMLAAFKVLLYRYTHQTDICVGTSTATRSHRELEGLIGFFVNTLALRSDLNNNPSFISLLQQVKTTTLDAYEHQDVPFEKIVEAVVKDRDASRSPLFQVMFVMQNTPDVPELRLGEIVLSTESSGPEAARFDITFFVEEREGGLEVSIVYRSQLFSEDRIRRMAGHYEQLLQGVVNNPLEQINYLPLLTSEEKQLLPALTEKTVPYAADQTIVDMFAAVVARTPQATALVFEGQSMSYEELDARATRLAVCLR